MNRYLIIGIILIVFLIIFFYSAPYLFQKPAPITNSPELNELNEKIKRQGYLTDDDVNKINNIAEEVDKQKE